MPEPISFVAGDELAEWLRTEAERRALTVPATVQALLAETYHDRERDPPTQDAESEPFAPIGDDGDADDDLSALTDAVASQGVETDALDRHPGAWTMVDRGNERYYAVDLPDGDREFHSTRSSAAESVADAYD
jgi:hypothetical protein